MLRSLCCSTTPDASEIIKLNVVAEAAVTSALRSLPQAPALAAVRVSVDTGVAARSRSVTVAEAAPVPTTRFTYT